MIWHPGKVRQCKLSDFELPDLNRKSHDDLMRSALYLLSVFTCMYISLTHKNSAGQIDVDLLSMGWVVVEPGSSSSRLIIITFYSTNFQ